MVTKFESNPAYGYGWWGNDAGWGTAQTITPLVTHYISSIKLATYTHIANSGYYEDVTISIKKTDGDGKPIGANLTSLTLSYHDLWLVSQGSFVWYEFTFPNEIISIKDSLYAIILRSLSAAHVWLDFSYMPRTDPGYIGGKLWWLDESTGEWELSGTYPDSDCAFEVWGRLPTMTTIADTNSILRAYLVAQTILTDIVGTRIYCPRLPENATLPALGFFTRGGTANLYLPSVMSPSIQFDCWATSPQAAREVYRALYEVLQTAQNQTVTVDGIDYTILFAQEEVQGQDLQDIDIPAYYRVLTAYSVMIRANII